MKTKRIFGTLLCCMMLLALLPTVALAAVPTPTVNGNYVYGNGVPLYISEATPEGGVPTTYVCTGGYHGANNSVPVTSWESNHVNDKHYIYGGCESGTLTANTAIYMNGGSVRYIYGGNKGDFDGDHTLTGSTHVEVSGGTVGVDVRGAGGSVEADVTGDVSVTISGNAEVLWDVYGSGSAPIGGNSSVTVSGGTIKGDVVGGGYSSTAAVGGNSSVIVSGGTVNGNVVGGGYSSGATVGTAEQSNTAKVTVTGGTIEADVYGQYLGAVNGDVVVALSGGTVSKDIYGAGDKDIVTGDVTVRVSGSFSTTGNGLIYLTDITNNRVDIAGALTGVTQNIKLGYNGTPSGGTVVAHAATASHADASKFTLVNFSGTCPIAAKANSSGGSDIVVAVPVTITLQKDDTAWNSHGQTVKLYDGTTLAATLSGSDSAVTGNAAPGVYDIYVKGADTGANLTVTDGGTNSQTVDFYTVSFSANGADSGTAPKQKIIPSGGKLTEPTATEHTLIKAGYGIEDWYKESDCITKWNFSIDTVTGARTLYPKWQRTGKALTAFSVNDVDGVINESAKTVSVTLPYGTDVTSLAATFTASDGATVKVGGVTQTSGTTANDFTSTVTYNVYSELSPAADPAVYTVTVAASTVPTPTVSGNNVYGNGVPLYISEATPEGGVPTTYVCTGGYHGANNSVPVTSWTSNHTGDSHYIYGGCESGTLTSNTAIYMNGGSVYYIYGGNRGDSDGNHTLTGSTRVEVSGGTVLSGVRGAGAYTKSNVTGDISITISGNAAVWRVYGSGSAHIGGNSSVTVLGGTVNGSVVGGGYSSTAAVGGNSSVIVSGGTVNGNVVGGGYSSGARVGGDSSVTISGGIIGGIDRKIIGGGYSGDATVGGDSSVTISGGTVNAMVYGEYIGDVDGSVTVRVSGSFSTTGNGQIVLSNITNNRVDIVGELTGGVTQNIKLVYTGTPSAGTVVAHAATASHADASKFTLVNKENTEYPLATKANSSGGSDIVVAVPVTVTLQKDDTAWDSHGQTVKLYDGTTLAATLSGGDSAVTGNAAPGVYDIYANSADTGANLTVTATETNSQTVNFYTVSFSANGADSGTAPAQKIVLSNQKLTEPTATEHTLAKAGYGIEGWYKESDCITKWNFSTDTVTGKQTLYPKWQKTGKTLTAFSVNDVDGVINENAKTVSVTLPYGTDVTSLAATFTASDGATVKVGGVTQTSGTTENDFTSIVTYNVYSELSPAANPAVYTVTVAASTVPTPTVNGDYVFGNGVPLYISETLDGDVPTTYVCKGGYHGANNSVPVTSWTSNHTGDYHYIYGGSENSALTSNTAVYMKSGSVAYIYGGNKSGKLTGNTIVVVSGGSVIGGLRGGGSTAASSVTGNSSVTVSGGTVNGSVFGGGTIRFNVVGDDNNSNSMVGGNSSVIISGGTVNGNVVGGGHHNGANVSGSSSVTISGGIISGTNSMIIGGGYSANVGTAESGNTAKVTITGGTVNAAVYGQLDGTVNGSVEVALSGGTVSKDIYGAGDKNIVTGNVTVRVSGNFSTTNDGRIWLSSVTNNRVDIVGELMGGVTQNIKLVYTGTPSAGTVVAHAATASHADASKFTLVNKESTEYPLAAKANSSGGSNIIVAVPVTVTLQKDGTAWNSHGQTITLYDGTTLAATLSGSDTTVTGNAAPGEYDIYANSADTGASLTVTDGGTNNQTVDFYTVSFSANGADSGTAPAQKIVLSNQKLTEPTAAEHSLIKAGYGIEGWYKESDCITKWNFSTDTVTGKQTLYPKWQRTGKALTAFSVSGVDGVINESAKTVSVTLPCGTDVTSLAATFTASDGATVKVGGVTQTSGTTANDFTSTVTYNVYSELSPAADPAVYTVTVTIHLTAPTNLAWGSDETAATASWGAVTNADSYLIQLYKVGTTDTAIGAAASVSALSKDFASVIEANGDGSYYFKVKAIGNGTAYSDSEWSVASTDYDYTVPHVAQHTIRVSANPAEGGTVYGGGTFNGGNRTVMATANTNYVFVRWTENNSTVSTSANYSFMLTEDRNLVAEFRYDPPYIPPTYSYYTLTFDTNGGSTIDSITRVEDTDVYLSDYITTREGYEFTGWYADSGLTERVIGVRLTRNITVYAGWEKVIIPDPVPHNPFIDVKETDWFYENVMFAFQNKFMIGTSDTTFEPLTVVNRAMLVTILWRIEGEPVVNYLMTFKDVPAESWYTEAVRWAASERLVNGYSAESFGPLDTLTREQMVTILYRYAAGKGYDVSGSTDLSVFTDANEVSDYALPAMRWAVAEGIIRGDAGKLMPGGDANRAQIAAVIERFIKKFVK